MEDVELESPFEDKTPEPNDFLLIQLELEERKNARPEVYYMGIVLNCDVSEYTISFLRVSSKMGNKNTFYFPENEVITSLKGDKSRGSLGGASSGYDQALLVTLDFKNHYLTST